MLDLVARLPRPVVEGLRWTGREQWHVTLRFLGTVEDARPVVDALAPVAATTAPFEVVLGPAVDRFGRRVLHIPVVGLEPLAAAVVGATAAIGEPPEDRPYAGHLTLARAVDPRRPRRGARSPRGPGSSSGAAPDLRSLCGTTVSATWTVSSFSLVESHLHPRGARYEELVSFPLTGEAGAAGEAGEAGEAEGA